MPATKSQPLTTQSLSSQSMNRRSMIGASALAAASLLSSQALAQNQSSRKVVVTIDDGPSSGAGGDLDAYIRITKGIREAFLAEKVPAILFVNERQLNVEGQRDARIREVEKWVDAGLDLGNHTYSHNRPDPQALHVYLDDIIRGEYVSRPLLEARGKKLEWYRYPYLATSEGETARRIEEFLEMRNYKIAPVTVDYHDYSFAGNYSRYLRAGQQEEADKLFQEVLLALDKAFDRSETESMRVLGYEIPQILLIHCNEMNALTLPTTIARIRDRGYEFVSMDEGIDHPAYKTEGLKPGIRGGGSIIYAIAGVPD